MTSTIAVLGNGATVVVLAKRMLFGVVSIPVCDRNFANASWLLHHTWHVCKQSAVIILQSVQNLGLSQAPPAGGNELGPCKARLLRSHEVCSTTSC